MGADITTSHLYGTNGAGPRFLGLDETRGYRYVANSDSHPIAVFAIGP